MFGVVTIGSWKLHLRVKNFGPSKSDAQIDNYALLPLYEDFVLPHHQSTHGQWQNPNAKD
jgi:hypothetical protein